MAKVVTVNPSKKMATRKPRAKTNPTPAPRRRRPRRRRNPTVHPALMATLGTLAGAAVGGGADIAMRYTALTPYVRGGILAGAGVASGLALSFLDPSLGAGVGGGLGSVGVAEIVLQATAPSTTDEASAGLAAVTAELGRVRAELGQLPRMPSYPALESADPSQETVYIDETDLAYV